MTLQRVPLILIVAGLAWAPLSAAPNVSNSPSSSGAITLSGEVQASDFFDQTFLITQGDGNVETVPFSRWTDFFQISADSRSIRRRQAIDPTDVKVGDRLYILLDPSGATAQLVEVLLRHTALTSHAARHRLSAASR